MRVQVKNLWGGYEFELKWKGENVRFTLDHIKKATAAGNLEIYWEFMSIDIPESIKPQTEKLMQVIQEAVTAWGWLSKNEGIENVYIDFSTFDQSTHQSIQ